jgi:hypothetical protein
LAFLELVKEKLGDLIVSIEEASKSWYKTGLTDIPIMSDLDPTLVQPLSQFSNMVRSMKANNQVLLYVRLQDSEAANRIITQEVQNERTRQGTLEFDPGTR